MSELCKDVHHEGRLDEKVHIACPIELGAEKFILCATEDFIKRGNRKESDREADQKVAKDSIIIDIKCGEGECTRCVFVSHIEICISVLSVIAQDEAGASSHRE